MREEESSSPSKGSRRSTPTSRGRTTSRTKGHSTSTAQRSGSSDKKPPSPATIRIERTEAEDQLMKPPKKRKTTRTFLQPRNISQKAWKQSAPQTAKTSHTQAKPKPQPYKNLMMEKKVDPRTTPTTAETYTNHGPAK